MAVKEIIFLLSHISHIHIAKVKNVLNKHPRPFTTRNMDIQTYSSMENTLKYVILLFVSIKGKRDMCDYIVSLTLPIHTQYNTCL